MAYLKKKNYYCLLFFLFLFFYLGLGQIENTSAVTKVIGGTATITVSCSDGDGNLTQCKITQPIAASTTCSFGPTSSGSCSNTFTCTTEGTFDVCGQAIDTTGLTDSKCLDVVICTASPYIGSQTIEYEAYCGVAAGTGQIGFKWIYRDPDGDFQSRFDFRINDINNVNDPSPEVDRSFTGLSNPDGTVNNQTVLVVSPPETDKITYGKTYYWWARVWDSPGANSGWIAGPFFTTVSHAYPNPDFTHSPKNPSPDEVVLFTDISKCYSSPGNIEYSCQNGGAAIQYEWDFDYNGTFTVDSTQKGNTTTTYSSIKNYEVRLRITDDTLSPAGVCIGKGDSPVGTTLPLPEWKEVPPTSWLKNFLASISGFVINIF